MDENDLAGSRFGGILKIFLAYSTLLMPVVSVRTSLKELLHHNHSASSWQAPWSLGDIMKSVFGPTAVGAQQPPPVFALTFECIFGLHNASAATRMTYTMLVPAATAAFFFILAAVVGMYGKPIAKRPAEYEVSNGHNPSEQKFEEDTTRDLSSKSSVVYQNLVLAYIVIGERIVCTHLQLLTR